MEKCRRRRIKTAARLFPVILLAAAVTILSLRGRSLLQICFLDVGQGDGVVIQTPAGACVMIDGGSSSKKNLGRYQLEPYLKNQGIAYIDAIFVSHTDHDHISGLQKLLEDSGDGLTTIRAGYLVLPDWADPPDSWKELAGTAERSGTKVVTSGRGDTFTVKDTTFEILAPNKNTVAEDINEASLVIELHYGEFDAIFTGDIGKETEERLAEDQLLSDVELLKTAHHGSRYSSSKEFLQAVRAETAVISCSYRNVYGHPAPETIERLEEAGCQIEYTMKSGAVTVCTDGKNMAIYRFLAEKSPQDHDFSKIDAD